MSVVRRASSTIASMVISLYFTILGKNDAYMTLCNNHVLRVAPSSGHYQVCSSFIPVLQEYFILNESRIPLKLVLVESSSTFH